ncbi:thiosulfate-3-mercaptopyruvate sulfurtransferase protein [Marine Group I thaumarchaeote SCGC AAA799-E16]|uniref:Thiosulfate-3-mercaptopyruvate sulfurtransferase protein n=3 Tax=Marine Group I TaxID=905826 RepID=A0A087S970_9ARCH|nr:thiosulfate-3-mercaptopyruvate sulfurtransferase protein [Marine Group I thaumarchaeote SCGC AAA799-E16]KFM18465.1 putative 3-mercaptopyruvate sulfurtransferase protein [Marine Group I thaumarchaeote SCGC RSA3]KFM22274.1 thiosulfate-3-mercaptopyruvate sulfurtransferase protein [Marine Group I thaumarchaeote SCGC AAA799-B03]
MCCLTESGNITTDVDSLRSEIRDKSVRVIDVRREDDYKKDHISTAVNLPLANLLSDDSPERVVKLVNSMGIDDETRVVVYDDTFGALASRVAWTLEYLGHSDVSLLETTYSNWKSLGLESDSQTPEVQNKEHSVKLQPDILATSDYLENAKQRDDVILIDNRERLNYLEQHIPGAISLPYRTLASNDKILRPKEDMKRLLDNRGVTGDAEIITYCGSVGTLSGLAYYALKTAGLPNAKLYVRSFKEWKNLQKPTVKQEDANYWDLSAE